MTENTVNPLAMPDPKTNIVLVPQQEITGRLDDMHVVRWSTVVVDIPNETYDVQGGGKGLHKSVLNRICSAAGVRVVSSKPMQPITDDQIIWQAVVEMDMAGEQPIRMPGTKEWRKGVGKDGNDLEHRLGKTETKAILRALRGLMGIKSKYSVEELARPIAVPHIDYSPDYSNPDVREALAGKTEKAVAALYGGGDPVVVDDEDAPIEGVVVEEHEEPPTVAPTVTNTETGETMPDFAEEPPAPVAAPPAEPKVDARERQRTLQAAVFESTGSAFDGMTFADIYADERGGHGWFMKVISWGKATTLTPGQQAFVDEVVEFHSLVKKHKGLV